MPEPQDFINQSRTVGKPDKAIFAELKAAGWTDDQLQSYFPNLTGGLQPVSVNPQQTTAQNAHKAKKRWLQWIGLFALLMVLVVAAAAAYQYFDLSKYLQSETASPVPDSEIASPSAQLQPEPQMASSSAKVVYVVTDPETEDIQISAYDLGTDQKSDLYTISASDSATLTAGYWSPAGRYLPITVAADQPQVLIYDSQLDQINKYQSEFSNPWEIAPGFLAYWSSSSTVIINEEDIVGEDAVTSYEMSPSGDVIAAAVEPRIKFGTNDYTIDYGLENAKTADIVLMSQQVPVVLMEQVSAKNSISSLVPIGLKEKDDAVWFYSVDPVAESTQSSQLSFDASAEAEQEPEDYIDVFNSGGASTINSTMSAVLGVTTPTGFETHLHGFSATGENISFEEQIISEPGWMTSKVLLHPQTQDFYILEYQQLDDSGNGLVQLRQVSYSDPENKTATIEFTTNVARLIPDNLGLGTYDFTEDGEWFVFEQTDLTTGQNQIAAQQVSNEISSDPIIICNANCDWHRVFNPETLVPR